MGRLSIEDRDDVRVLTLDDEARHNAVDTATLRAIATACADAGDGVRCLVLTGRGDRAFCAGYDLGELAALQPGDPLPDAELQRTARAIESAKPPVIAAVNGLCVGAGGELAAACDLRVGARKARLSMPPARLGIVYPPEGLRRFAALVGAAQARRLFYTAEVVEAMEGERIGFFQQLADDALAASLELARSIAANAPLAVQGMKAGFRLPSAPTAEESASFEAMRRASYHSEDAREGLAAVREKRTPRFKGR